MVNDSFILYLVKKSIENFVFILGFIFAIIGYTLWKPLGIALNLTDDQSYSVFYICISVSFFFYTFAYYLTKYHKWRWFPMFVYLVCLSRVFVEFSDVVGIQEHDIVEYAFFVVTIFIVVIHYVLYRYKKYLKRNEDNNPTNTD